MGLVAVCHCSHCRKDFGASFAAVGGVPEGGFRWICGENEIRRYESSPGFFRNSCLTCGSATPGEPGQGRVFMPLGCVEGDPGARPQLHLFTASRAPWHEILDDLPRFEEMPPGFEAPDLPADERPRSEPGTVRGSCLCNEAAWELRGELALMRNCHCSRCRKARGTAYATNAFAAPDGFRWVRGEDEAVSYKVPEARFFRHTFCRSCGATLPRVDAERNLLIVPVGSIDGDPGARPRDHIFVASKAPWFEIADDLAQYAERAPSRPPRGERPS